MRSSVFDLNVFLWYLQKDFFFRISFCSCYLSANYNIKHLGLRKCVPTAMIKVAEIVPFWCLKQVLKIHIIECMYFLLQFFSRYIHSKFKVIWTP